MQKRYLYILIFAMLNIFISGCSNDIGQNRLATPVSLALSLDGRVLTVSWNAVTNASGYIIYMTSTGCGSGNRNIDTAAKIVTNHDGVEIASESADQAIVTKGNGFITFLSDTSFAILLMSKGKDNQQVNVPMASSVSVKIKAIGTGIYLDSDFSEYVKLSIYDK